MRGLALLLTAASGIAILAACDGSSGTGFLTVGNATASVDTISFTSGTQQQQGSYPLSLQSTVALAKQVPLMLTGIGIHAPGANQVTVPGAAFTWVANFAKCGGTAASTPATVLDYQDPSAVGTPDPNHPGYALLQASDVKSSIAVFPQVAAGAVILPAGYPIVPPVPPATAPPAPPITYCLQVTATNPGSGKNGGATVTFSLP